MAEINFKLTFARSTQVDPPLTFSVRLTYLWVGYGCHIIVQFIRVEGDGGRAVDVGVWLRVSPLHQAGETTVAHTVWHFSVAVLH